MRIIKNVTSFFLLWMIAVGAVSAPIVYEFSGTCDDATECAFVGLNAGDPVSGTLTLAINLSYASDVNTPVPVSSDFELVMKASGGSLTQFDVGEPGGGSFTSPYFFNGSTWFHSLSAGGVPGGAGTWTLGATGGGLITYDFAGTCDDAIECAFVGLNVGDPVSGSVTLGIDLSYANDVNTPIPVSSDFELVVKASGGSLTQFDVGEPGGGSFTSPYFFNGSTWFHSLSAGGVPGGAGAWTLAEDDPGGGGRVPEPPIIALLAIGLLGLIARERRKGKISH